MVDRLDCERITVGQELVPIKKYMTQEKINTYISAAEDFNPIHVDIEYAKNTPFKSTIAPGYHFIAYLSELMTRDFGEKWLTGGSMELRLFKPVLPKDTLIVGGKVVEKNQEEKGNSIKCDLWIRNQEDKDVIIGYSRILY